MNKILTVALVSSIALMGCNSSPEVAPTEIETSRLKDGDYSKRQTYSPVEGYEFYIEVSLTLKDELIESIAVVGDPEGKSTVRYEKEFKDGLAAEIVGKSIEEAKALGYVAGASSTSQAFEDALDAIASEAAQ